MNLRESLFQNKDFSFQNHVFYQDRFPTNSEFEQTYLKIREQENRIYTDEELKKLPEIEYTHPLKIEWKLREKSMKRLINHFREIPVRSILEVGCGNGWLSHQLAQLPGTEVLGMDVNETELLQGARVFKSFSNLAFTYADIESKPTLPAFDAIVLASSIQYFRNVRSLIEILLTMLAERGVIHIVDSPVYSEAESEAAKDRSENYFNDQHSAMQRFYHHHTWDAFDGFSYELMYNPDTLSSRIKKILSPDSPFPWIRITQ